MQRLFSFIIASALAAAPVLSEACQIACASTSPTPSAHHAGHCHVVASEGACHEASAASHYVSSQAPPCDHNDATVPSVAAARTPDIIVLFAAAPSPVEDVLFVRAATSVPLRLAALRDCLEIPRATPLRV